jgi:Ca2+-binding RTX toxin-like protein
MAASKAILSLVLLGAAQLRATPIALDGDDIQIVYDEASASMDIGIDVRKFDRVEGSMIEIQVHVTTADGTQSRHDLVWTSGESGEILGFELPAVSNGLYEVVLTRLVIDGEAIAEPLPHASMRLLGVRSHDDWVGQGVCPHGDAVHGTQGPDELFGTAGNDEILGHEGNDTLHGLACDDFLDGSEGNDVLYADEGDDVVHGGAGYDQCFGGQGTDIYFGCEEVTQ